MAEDPNVVYPYSRPTVDASGAPVRRPVLDASGNPAKDASGDPLTEPVTEPVRDWRIRFQPVLLQGMYKRCRKAAQKTVTRGREERVEFDGDLMNAALWKEMIIDGRVPDLTTPGQVITLDTPENYDRVPVYIAMLISAEIDKRNGSELHDVTSTVVGQVADFRGPTATPGPGQVAEPVPSVDPGTGQ